MQPSKERIYYLLKSYTDGTATATEKEELYAWGARVSDDSEIKQYVKELLAENENAEFPEVDWEYMYRQIIEKSQDTETFRKGRKKIWLRIAAAVLTLVLGSGAIYLFLTHNNRTAQRPVIAKNIPTLYKNDIKPGSTKAILCSGDSSVALSSIDTSFTLAGNKVHINNGDVKIAKAQPVEYTLIAPRGGTYSLVLADGTKVWLNADSKLVYPSVFSGNTRDVKLVGEAYFKVKTDAEHPFIVHTDNHEVTVLGTEFNIRAYKNEPYTTTLVEGKVAVKDGNKKLVLGPGQQAWINEDGNLSLNEHPDLEQVVAWKNGYFRFDKADIHAIMRSLARWYDIDVEYATDVSQHYFGAIMNRDNNISKILKMLEATGEVHFEIEGRTVRVKR